MIAPCRVRGDRPHDKQDTPSGHPHQAPSQSTRPGLSTGQSFQDLLTGRERVTSPKARPRLVLHAYCKVSLNPAVGNKPRKETAEADCVPRIPECRGQRSHTAMTIAHPAAVHAQNQAIGVAARVPPIRCGLRADSTPRTGHSCSAALLGKWSAVAGSCGTRGSAYREGRADQGFREPAEAAQARDTVADPHRNPTDQTADFGTLVMRVKGTENSQSAAYMRASWAAGASSR